MKIFSVSVAVIGYVSQLVDLGYGELTFDDRDESAGWLQFVQPVIDLGTLRCGEKKQFDFVVTNTGGRVCFVRRTHASCGCTLAELPEDLRVLAGENFALPVVLKPGNTPGRMAVSLMLQFDTSGTSNLQSHVVLVAVIECQNTEQDSRLLPVPDERFK